MRKVLIVDDEKLVRQGIIATFPWNKHGFRVVGEAANGERALEQIESLKPDLLVTDITMPGMSGFQLIERVWEERPELPVVILTCHDSFRYVQDAMRMGVLDYILKTEIEDEMIEETLVRIADKLNELDGGEPAAPHPNAARSAGDGILVCGRQPGCGIGEVLEAAGGRHAPFELDRMTWFLSLPQGVDGHAAAAELRECLASDRYALALLVELNAPVGEDMAARLRKFRWRDFYYAFDGEGLWQGKLPADEPAAPAGSGEDGPDAWREPAWVHDDEAFGELLDRMRLRRQEPAALKSLFYHVTLEWDRLLGMDRLQELVERSDYFLFWIDWADWLAAYRIRLADKLGENASMGIRDQVLKAIELLNEAEDLDINEAEIARRVNMSRGYFSTCFKKVTGQSFGEYLKRMKLERAKRLIVQTDDSVTLTAEKCGFRDYRYFSRVFREYTGMLPVEYRKAYGGGGKR